MLALLVLLLPVETETLTPGTVALVVGAPAGDERARARVLEGLASPSGPVRAAAARVAFARGEPGAAELRAALDRETLAEPGLEIVRALVPASNGDVDAEILNHARRLRIEAPAWRLLARSRGTSVLALLPAVAGGDALGVVARELADSAADVRARLADEVLARNDAATWSYLLEVPAPLPVEAVARALGHAEAAIRRHTYVYLAQHLDVARMPAVAEARAHAPEASGTGDVPTAFALEVLERRLDPRRPVSDTWAPRLAAYAGDPLFWKRVVLAATTGEERRVLDAIPGRGPGVEELLRRMPPPQVGPPPYHVRTPGPLPGGLVSDVLRLVRCDPKKETWSIAEGAFEPSGRARKVAIGIFKGSAECRRALDVIHALDAAPTPPRSPRPHVVFARLDEDAVRCLDEPQVFVDVPAHGHAEPARPTRRVPPQRPANSPTRAGLVVMDARVSPTGCLQYAEVVDAAHPSLDVEALKNLTLWRLAPASVDGQPVPGRILASVDFR